MSGNTYSGDIEQGDTVVLAETHHAHNSELTKNRGRKGTVQKVKSDEKCLVAFEGQTADPLNQFWVARKWLERSADADADPTRGAPDDGAEGGERR